MSFSMGSIAGEWRRVGAWLHGFVVPDAPLWRIAVALGFALLAAIAVSPACKAAGIAARF